MRVTRAAETRRSSAVILQKMQAGIKSSNMEQLELSFWRLKLYLQTEALRGLAANGAKM